MNEHVVAQQANFVIAPDHAVVDIAPGNAADLRNPEHVAHLRAALVDFLEHGFQHPGHGLLDLVGQFVNDRVQADVHLFLLGRGLRRAVGTDVEPHNDRVRRRRQQHVRFGNRAHARMQHANLHLVVRQLLQRIRQNLGGAADIGLQDNVQLLGLAFLQLIVELIERNAIRLRHRHFARLGLAIDDDLLGLGGVSHHLQRIAHIG